MLVFELSIYTTLDMKIQIQYIILFYVLSTTTDIIVNIDIQIKQKKSQFFVSICTDVSIFNQCVSYTRRYNDKH